MNIRKANNKDLPQLTQLIIEFKEGLTDSVPDSQKIFRVKRKPIDLIKKSVKEEIDDSNGLLLVVEDENKIVGFAFGTIKNTKHMVFEPVKFGMLNHIWISQDYRGQGLASKCKDKLFSWFKENNCEYVRLSVLDANNAKQIYEKWGFEIEQSSMVKNF